MHKIGYHISNITFVNEVEMEGGTVNDHMHITIYILVHVNKYVLYSVHTMYVKRNLTKAVK
jgi:hypothetical protein